MSQQQKPGESVVSAKDASTSDPNLTHYLTDFPTCMDLSPARFSPVAPTGLPLSRYDADFGRKVCQAFEAKRRVARYSAMLRKELYGWDSDDDRTLEEARLEYSRKQDEAVHLFWDEMDEPSEDEEDGGARDCLVSMPGASGDKHEQDNVIR